LWPASGIALAAVLLLGRSVWPGIWIGAFLANITIGEPVLTAVSIASGNTLEAVAVLWLLQRFGEFDTALERLRDVFRFVLLGAVAAPIVAATIGVVSLCVGGVHPWSHAPILWTIWWVGDAIGVLVAAPIFLTARAWRRWRPTPFHAGEAAVLLRDAPSSASVCSAAGSSPVTDSALPTRSSPS